MIKCPVCGQYEFERKDDFDVCEVCEWENDGVQLSDPDYEGGANYVSLNQYLKQWNNRICPCCYQHHFEYDNNFETCPVCKWQDDGVQRDDPDYPGGANKLSLNQFRAQWQMNQESN